MGGTPIQDCLPSDSPSHTIGTVTFGKDGSLYVGNGDGAKFNGVDPRALRAQNIDQWQLYSHPDGDGLTGCIQHRECGRHGR